MVILNLKVIFVVILYFDSFRVGVCGNILLNMLLKKYL